MIAAAAVVAVTNFVAKNRASIEALKSAKLLKNLNLNVLIESEGFCGKTLLAKEICEAKVYDAIKYNNFYLQLNDSEKIIIKNFAFIDNFDKFYEKINLYNIKIVATTSKNLEQNIYDRFFSIKIVLPPLRQRREDVVEIANIIVDNFYSQIGCEFKEGRIKIDYDSLDVSQNGKSLIKHLYSILLAKNLNKNEMIEFIENFIYENIENLGEYKDLINIYDDAIVGAYRKKYKSQLKIATILNINRNTLRKKVEQYELETK